MKPPAFKNTFSKDPPDPPCAVFIEIYRRDIDIPKEMG
jgi:hypothetical protein